MATKMVYEWGSRSFHVDAQIVGETVDRITSNEGYCAPARLVDAARKDTSPIHNLFTWDNKVAADKWRTHEARQIINALTVTMQMNGEQVSAPAFLSVGHVVATQDAGEGYRPLSVVISDDAFAREAMADVVMRLRAIRRRYETIEALSPLWKVLEELETV